MRSLKGQAQIVLVIVLAVAVVVAASFFALLPPASVQAAIARVESTGDYVILTMAQYNIINAKLDSIATKADAAVVAAQAAVVTAQAAADKVDLFNSADVYLFPATTNRTCQLTAGNTNEWGAWTEVADNATTTLSSAFAVNSGYVSDMLFFLPSDAADGYSVEISYGASKTNLGRISFWALADGDVAYVLPIKSRRVPAGETIYYRMSCTGANGATCQARFRYFYE